MVTVFLCLGTNKGERKMNLLKAIQAINMEIGHIVNLSGIYQTEPWGFSADTDFLNMTIECLTNLSAEQLLDRSQAIEDELGRLRVDKGYAPRPIDIDLLFYGNEIIDTVDLRVPHFLLHRRRFVLEPLAEIAAEKVHPVLKKTVAELLEECDDVLEVELLGSISDIE